MVPVIVLSFQGQGAPIPLLDYSRTARGQNEEAVIPRELFVRRSLFLACAPPASLCLFFPGGARPERRGRIASGTLHRTAWPHFPIRCGTQHRELVVKMP